MVRWQNTDGVRFGVATCNFSASNHYHLPLNLGDSVLIYEETDDAGWYRGCPLLNRTVKGIFPVSHVHVKWNIDCISSNDSSIDIATSKELSVVLEISSVLKEWGALWKQLFVKNNAEGIESLRPLLLDVISRRRQIMSRALTSDQLRRFRLEISNKIDYGNKFLGLDMVVRDSDGNIIDVDSTGVIDLYKRHLESAQRMEQPEESRKSRFIPSRSYNQYTVHNLYISVKNVVCKVDDDFEVFITLYDGAENAFISEHYVMGWDRNGMPKDLDKLQNLTCLFTDLGNNDLKREKLYLVCQIIRDGRMAPRNNDHKKLTQKLRRPFGVAVLHVSDIVTGEKQEDTDKETFIQLQVLNKEDDIETGIKKCIQRITTQSQGTGQGIWVTLQMVRGDVNQVKEEHPLLINQFTTVARKQGFPDIIMPGDVRNDMYLTLVSGIFDRGTKRSDKNIQVTVGVYDANGDLLENVLSAGANEPMVTEHYSTVYYHNASPRWNEVIKLSIPAEKVNGATVRFAFKHRATMDEKDRSQKTFSVAYVNLIGPDGTYLQDSDHELAVYKCDGKKGGDNALLKLPSIKSDVKVSKKAISAGGFSFNKTESFRIVTKLCSTKLAQNVDLLALLKWRSQKQNLRSILPALVKVSGEEIVKFLQDTFDALFAILMDNAEEFGGMVADALLFCIGLLDVARFKRFRSILDAYIENLFSSTKAYITLIEVLQNNLENAQRMDVGPEYRDQLRNYYKALEYWIKFIVRSRSLSESATPGVGGEEFERSISKLCYTIISIMKMTGEENLIIQGYALKYIPAVFGDLLLIYDPVLLGKFYKDMIEITPVNRLVKQKLSSIHQVVKSPLFTNPRSRAVIRPMLISQLRMNLEKFDDLKDCADILNEMFSSFTSVAEMGDIDDDIEYIVTHLFRCIVETVIRMDLKHQIVGNYVAFIISTLDLLKDHHYIAYINSYKDDEALLDGLMELFLVFREFIKESVFPFDWVSMTMIQNNVILGALQYFSEAALYERFLVADSFQYQLWENFFQLAVAFITQDCLQLETFSESKRNKILEKYSDMRMVIGKKIIDMWHRLGRNKIRLIQNMVRPFLEMTLIPETELRKATIPVFFDMIECEFRHRTHFKQVESELIMHLDHLIESGMKGDEEYKELFSQILSEKFHQAGMNNQFFYECGLAFVDTITKLLSRLLDYRSVISSEDNINNRMSCNVNILNFYQDIRREEMKERYLYKLCDLHLSVKSFTEAAFTLLQHAELLEWSDEPLSNANSNITSNRYDVKTQRELKEHLYLDIIDYFDKGKMWEYGIKRCKDLAKQYESETYDYEKLSQILRKEAQFFENIIKTVVRPEPTYFRVGYYGRGFPTFLRNKLFIYRGEEFESLNDFSMRLKVQFPVAQFLKTLEQPGPDITDSLQQWVQVCKVDPKPVKLRRFQGKNVADQIKKFYEVNEVSEFALNRPFHKGVKDKESEFTTLWIERTTMNTQYSFPGKLRWSEVTSVNSLELSPIENAVDTMLAKNKELMTLINQHTADNSLNLNPLSMALNGVIDAAVMGGISNYEKMFFCKDYMKAHPDQMVFINQLQEQIVEQVDICERGLRIHGQLVSKELEPFHKKMEVMLKENKLKALPYRKAEDKRMSTISHKAQVFGMRGKTDYSNTQSAISPAPPLPNRERNTIMANFNSPASRNSGYRHTTIIGPSSPVVTDIAEPPPLPDKMMTLPRKKVQQPHNTHPLKLSHTLPARTTSPTTAPQEPQYPPDIPRKLKVKSQAKSKPVPPDAPDMDDDAPPPLLPKKAGTKERPNKRHEGDVANKTASAFIPRGIESPPQPDRHIHRASAAVSSSARSAGVNSDAAPSIQEFSEMLTSDVQLSPVVRRKRNNVTAEARASSASPSHTPPRNRSPNPPNKISLEVSDAESISPSHTPPRNRSPNPPKKIPTVPPPYIPSETSDVPSLPLRRSPLLNQDMMVESAPPSETPGVPPKPPRTSMLPSQDLDVVPRNNSYSNTEIPPKPSRVSPLPSQDITGVSPDDAFSEAVEVPPKPPRSPLLSQDITGTQLDDAFSEAVEAPPKPPRVSPLPSQDIADLPVNDEDKNNDTAVPADEKLEESRHLDEPGNSNDTHTANGGEDYSPPPVPPRERNSSVS